VKTILVIAAHPDSAEAVRASLDPKHYRLIHRTNAEVAEPLLAHGVADVCIADVDLTGVQSAWSLEKLKRKAPDLPLIVYTSARQWEWEEEAYLRGATCVLSKPVRPRTLQAVLERVCAHMPRPCSPKWQSFEVRNQARKVPSLLPRQVLLIPSPYSAIARLSWATPWMPRPC